MVQDGRREAFGLAGTGAGGDQGGAEAIPRTEPPEGGFLLRVGRPFHGDFGEETGSAFAPAERQAHGEAGAFEDGVLLRRKLVDQVMEWGVDAGKVVFRKSSTPVWS